VILAGASSSVVRAGIMGSLGLIALNIGRLYAITNALAFTAVVMVFVNPLVLHFDVGFQLSFLALMGLVYLTPMLEPYFERIPKTINKYLIPTIAAQIFTLPILLLNFDRLSLVAPLANLLILPVIPLAMLFGFLTGIVGMIFAPLAMPLAWITWGILTYIIKIVEFISRIPLASLEINYFSIFLAALYYIGLLYFLWRQQLKTYFIS